MLSKQFSNAYPLGMFWQETEQGSYIKTSFLPTCTAARTVLCSSQHPFALHDELLRIDGVCRLFMLVNMALIWSDQCEGLAASWSHAIFQWAERIRYTNPLLLWPPLVSTSSLLLNIRALTYWRELVLISTAEGLSRSVEFHRILWPWTPSSYPLSRSSISLPVSSSLKCKTQTLLVYRSRSMTSVGETNKGLKWRVIISRCLSSWRSLGRQDNVPGTSPDSYCGFFNARSHWTHIG